MQINNNRIRNLNIEHVKKCKLDETRIYMITTIQKDFMGKIFKQKKKAKLIQQTDYMFVFETLDGKRLKEIIYKLDYVINKKIITKCPSMSVNI